MELGEYPPAFGFRPAKEIIFLAAPFVQPRR
jgi:hypothetical protein